MWECPCATSMGPVPFLGELGLMWTPATSLLGVCRVGEGAGLEMEGLGLQPAVRHSVFSAQWLSPPCQGQGCSQLAGVEALRVRLELTLCSLQCVFPSPHSGVFAPKEESTEEAGLVCSDHSIVCSLAPTHPTISSFLLLWPPQI